ncbi:hypothetical protein FB45DRAFT_922822 [Roridomyces roridus]|uniref:F-box domain-containing protein n=1 Tax=Roridomyces roridus TaxID=1738132 RepID=A0AAD7BND2_9AGAR|nr:hypothetical protein FB45DRAFT_922822 [Roridomyces roridus]
MSSALRCPQCSFDFIQPLECSSRSHLRARLSQLDTLIAALSAERDALRLESDSIVYPILTLPAEIITEIFRHCISPLPKPSPSAAPLLLTQVCRLWRQIAVANPWLWRSLSVDARVPREVLQAWLLRGGNMPLELTLHSKDALAGNALLETSLPHSYRWQDVSFRLPVRSFLLLHLGDAHMPSLRKISVDTNYVAGSINATISDRLVIRNAPLLREVQITTLPRVRWQLPWRQLTTLTLNDINLAECLTLLEECLELQNFGASTTGAADTDQPLLTLPHLQSLAVNLADHSLLDYVTLPQLKRLSVRGSIVAQHATVLASLFHRSQPPLDTFGMTTVKIGTETKRLCLLALPDSVSHLKLTELGRKDESSRFASLNDPDVVLSLKHFTWSGNRPTSLEYQDLLRFLNAHKVGLVVTLTIVNWSGVYMPQPAVIAQIRALAAEGMNIRFTGTGLANETHVIFDSAGACACLLGVSS